MSQLVSDTWESNTQTVAYNRTTLSDLMVKSNSPVAQWSAPGKETKNYELSQETWPQLPASSGSIHIIQEQFCESMFIFLECGVVIFMLFINWLWLIVLALCKMCASDIR